MVNVVLSYKMPTDERETSYLHHHSYKMISMCNGKIHVPFIYIIFHVKRKGGIPSTDRINKQKYLTKHEKERKKLKRFKMTD